MMSQKVSYVQSRSVVANLTLKLARTLLIRVFSIASSTSYRSMRRYYNCTDRKKIPRVLY